LKEMPEARRFLSEISASHGEEEESKVKATNLAMSHVRLTVLQERPRPWEGSRRKKGERQPTGRTDMLLIAASAGNLF